MKLRYSFRKMNRLLVAAFIGLTCVVASAAQTPAPGAPVAPKPPAVSPAKLLPAVAHEENQLTAETEHDLFARYCVGCHNEKAKASGVDSSRKLTIDSIDFHDVRKSADKLELIVRKMR